MSNNLDVSQKHYSSTKESIQYDPISLKMLHLICMRHTQADVAVLLAQPQTSCNGNVTMKQATWL